MRKLKRHGRVGLDQVLEPFRLVESNDRVFNRNASIFAELTKGARHGFPGGASHGGHLFVSQEQREPESAIYMLADLVCQLQQQAAKPSGNGLCQ